MQQTLAVDVGDHVIAGITPFVARVGIRNQLLVKVTTRGGVTGWGEAGLSGRENAVAAAIRHYADFLVGRDARNIAALWQECYRSQYFEGGRVLTAAISAIDIALHDALGRMLGVPVWQLLGGRQRDVIPAYATCYTEGDGTEEVLPAALEEEIAELVQQGWTSIRIPFVGIGAAGRFDARDSLAPSALRVIAVRERFGDGLMLGIDYHHRLSPAEAASFCQRLPDGALDYLEEPIRAENPGAYAALRQLTTMPFAVGEEFSSKWQAAPFIERDLIQYLRLDICNIGGFTEAMKVLAMAETHYIEAMPHNPLGAVSTAATVHMAAATAIFCATETHQTFNAGQAFHDARIFPVQPMLDGTAYPVPTGPGLGIEVDEDALGRATATAWEPPHLRRSDGSYTNW
jgi:galactonate dehydratase